MQLQVLNIREQAVGNVHTMAHKTKHLERIRQFCNSKSMSFSFTNLNYPDFITLDDQPVKIGWCELDNVSLLIKGKCWCEYRTNCNSYKKFVDFQHFELNLICWTFYLHKTKKLNVLILFILLLELAHVDWTRDISATKKTEYFKISIICITNHVIKLKI